MSDRPADADDLRDELIQAIHEIARYWANLPDIDPASSRPLTIRGRCEGVAFSILSLLDGASDLPAFDLTVADPDDPRGGLTISDALHERFAMMLKGYGDD